MKKPLLLDAYHGRAALLLYAALFVAPAMAEEAADSNRVPLHSMNQAEYETYREQLRQHEAGTVQKAVEPAPAAAGEAKQQKSGRSGYGQGYSTRAERGGRPDNAGAHRGGMMGRGAGHR